MATNRDNCFRRHRGPVTCVASIPDSKWVLTSGYDGAVGLFDLQGGGVELLGYHQHLVNRVVVNAAGTKAASSSSDYMVGIWDLCSRRLERILRGHSDDVEDFVFVDDKMGASVSRDWRVLLWDLETGNILRVLEGHDKDVLSVDYHDGKLFTSSDDMTMRVWDLDTGQLLKMWGPFETETDTCTTDPIHQRALLGCDDGVIRIFDIASGDTLAQLKAHSSGIKKVAVSPVSGDIMSAAYDQKILIWDAVELTEKVRLESHPSLWERSFNWSGDGERILAGTFDGTVIEWEAKTGKCLGEIGEMGPVQGNACFNDVSTCAEGEIVLVSDDGYLRMGVLTAEKAEVSAKIEPASGRVLMNAVTTDPAYGKVITGAHNHGVFLYDKTNGTVDNETEVHLGEGPVNSIRISPHPGSEGEAFVACYSGAIVRVSATGEIKGKFSVHENAVKALRIHPHKPVGVSCSADGILASWNIDGELFRHYPGHMAIIDDVDIDPTGTYIASVGRDFTLKVHGFDDGLLYYSISLGRRSPKGVCFYTNNVVIVTNYWGELLKVTLADGKVTRRNIARNGISAIVPNGDFLVAVSYDGAAYLIRSEDLKIVNSLRAMTQRVDENVFV